MGFWNALSVLAPIAPGQAEAAELQRQRNLDNQRSAIEFQQAKEQMALNREKLLQEQQKTRLGNLPPQPTIFGQPEWDSEKKAYSVLALDPQKGIVRLPIPGGQSPQEKEYQNIFSQIKPKVDVYKNILGRDLTDKEFLAVTGVKMPMERIHIGTAVPVSKDISNTGWGRPAWDTDTGEILYYTPDIPPSRDLPRVTTGKTYNPQLGMWVGRESTSTPIIPGVSAPFSSGWTPSAGVPSVGTPPVRGGSMPSGFSRFTGGGTPKAAKDGSAVDVNSAPSVLRFPSMSVSINKVADSISSLQQQIVGSGNDPLWDYADLFDNPKARQAINLALTSSMNPVPTPSEQGGIGSAIATITGLTNWAQKVQNQNAVNARNKVLEVAGQRGLDLVARLAELKGSIPTLRTITGASAAQASIAPLIQESAVLNASSSADFRKRIALTERTLASALKVNPAINPAYSNWLFQMADAAEPPKQTGRGKQLPARATGTQKSASMNQQQYSVGSPIKLKDGSTVYVTGYTPDGKVQVDNAPPHR